jgi:hypothetical protein
MKKISTATVGKIEMFRFSWKWRSVPPLRYGANA